ncbi:MAG: UDP-glucose 4-epimerase GalE [Parachlamydiales bacterium]|nr:UDP-glucose 4-epimerase GalE [Parachlamydiales bacterium]
MAEPILVTGGAGYIGSHTCKALAMAGWQPVVFDNLSTGHGYAVKWGPFIQGDLNDRAALDKAFTTYKPKAVIHFAADAIVIESMTNPGKYYRNNVGSTISLLEAMRDHEVKKLVFSSTCATYGNAIFNPITEKHPVQPINPYGRSKWMNEEIIHDFEKAHGLEAVILRYFNAAGADLETQIGENHAPETHLIPNIIQTALGIREEIVVYGTDFPSKDGSAVRDYIHVMDLAAAHVAALNAPKNTINLGSGSGYSVLEIIQAVQQFCGHQISVRLENRREGEPGILTADFGKAREVLGWSPKFSDLPTLIESAWKWHQLLHENAHLVKSVLKC